MEFFPAYLLMARLEEEVELQRKLLNVLMVTSTRINKERSLKSLEYLRRTVNTLKLMVVTIESTERVSDSYTRESILLTSAECLSLTTMILEAFERNFPIFLESITLYEEPLVERMEDTVSFIESCVGRSDPSPTEEIAQSVDEIIKALEYYINVGERSLKGMV